MIETTTTQERYATAIQSSSLRVQADVRGDADMLIAMGWCKSNFGAALMRLQAEWDGAERLGIKVPLKPTKRAIQAEAQMTMKGSIRRITTQSMDAARAKLTRYYESEMRKLGAALKSLPEVKRMLQIKLLLDGQGAELAEPLLLYWLDPVCKVCTGQKYQRIPGAAKLSERACGGCGAQGVAKPPFGETGRAMLEFVESCAADAQGSARKRNS